MVGSDVGLSRCPPCSIISLNEGNIWLCGLCAFLIDFWSALHQIDAFLGVFLRGSQNHAFQMKSIFCLLSADLKFFEWCSFNTCYPLEVVIGSNIVAFSRLVLRFNNHLSLISKGHFYSLSKSNCSVILQLHQSAMPTWQLLKWASLWSLKILLRLPQAMVGWPLQELFLSHSCRGCRRKFAIPCSFVEHASLFTLYVNKTR